MGECLELQGNFIIKAKLSDLSDKIRCSTIPAYVSKHLTSRNYGTLHFDNPNVADCVFIFNEEKKKLFFSKSFLIESEAGNYFKHCKFNFAGTELFINRNDSVPVRVSRIKPYVYVAYRGLCGSWRIFCGNLMFLSDG
jgi:hypothetical protein